MQAAVKFSFLFTATLPSHNTGILCSSHACSGQVEVIFNNHFCIFKGVSMHVAPLGASELLYVYNGLASDAEPVTQSHTSRG